MPGTTDPTELGSAASHVDAHVNGLKTGTSMAYTSREGPKINGLHPDPEDAKTNGLAQNASAEIAKINGKQELWDQLPPEIEHITTGYRRIALLVERMVQETFNSLQEVIDSMVEIPILLQQPNGVTQHVTNRPNGGHSTDSLPNIRKKTQFFEWAYNRRAQFIKALVLSKWARQADSLSRVIDLRIWLVQRQTDYDEAAHWIGLLKRNLAPLKQHDPDIRTALEVLSLGRASWIPDLGLLPTEQMTSAEMLVGLRRINALLSTRINLHEKIPPGFRSFSISSGRATFRIPDECEVDLSIAFDDITKQLYFVDLRFTFDPPQSQLPAGRIRDDLEYKANQILARDGLSGLCDHLHGQVLTHKLLVLRQQAYVMASNRWASHLIVEPVRRAVVVQYWAATADRKSWIEIGIRREGVKLMPLTDQEQTFSNLSLRWFRNAKEVHDTQIDVRPANLSMQYILDQVQAKHTRFLFSGIIASLQKHGIYANNGLRLKISEKVSPSTSISLLIQLTPSRAIKLFKEPISGKAIILPSTNQTARAEHEINGSPEDGSGPILQLRSRIAQEIVENLAIRLDWEVLRSFRLEKSASQNLFPKGTQQVRYYRRRFWHQRWLLAFATSPEGDTWWAIEAASQELLASIGSARAAVGYSTALRIPQPEAQARLEASEASLADIERTTVGIISQYADTRHLASLRIPHKVQVSNATSGNQRFPSLYLRLPQTSLTPTVLKSPPDMRSYWLHEVIKLDYHGLSSSHALCIGRASCRVAQSFADLKDLASNMKGAAFNAQSGAFTLQSRTKVGETSIPQLLHRIAGIGRLHEFIAVIKAQKLKLDKFSMGSLTFTYQQSPQVLKASVIFPANNAMRLSLSAPNPHLRILDHLNSTLRTQGLASVLPLLSITQSLLSGLTSLEQKHQSETISIVPHSEQAYQVRYSAAKSPGSFEIVLKRRRDDFSWLIPEQTIRRPDPGFEEDKWREALRPVTRGSGQGWRGVNGGIIASLDGVTEALQRLDAVFEETKTHALQVPPAPAPAPKASKPQASRPGKRKAEGQPGDPFVIDD